jgi:hypothetical protein
MNKAKFRCELSFKIDQRSFVLAGRILDGVISKGDTVILSGRELSIYSIEFVNWISEKKSLLALVIKCESTAELEQLLSLPVQDVELVIM